MKKFLGTRIGVIIVTALACVVAFSGAAFAANFQKDIPATVNIKANNPDLAFYQDSACMVPITNVSFGDISQGLSGSQTIYVKNTGNVILTNITLASNMPETQGTVSMGFSFFALMKDASKEITLTLSIDQNAIVQDGYDPMIYFNCQ